MSAKQILMAAAGATGEKIYVEDVFSTVPYTGNNSTQTITNGIDLAGKGGMVWVKARNSFVNHSLRDSTRGAGSELQSNTAISQQTVSDGLSFTSSGFNLTAGGNTNSTAAVRYVSWAFRKAPNFFDVVTYTGDGASNRQISHALGSTPGCVIVKCTSTTASWAVWHRNIGSNQYMSLDSTAGANTDNSIFGGSPTATTFTVAGGGASVLTNQSGQTYIAYLFAHDAGGFGLSGAENVISCGSYTGNGSFTGPTVTLGYEPQWVLIKRATGGTGNWKILDMMRGVSSVSSEPVLQANILDSEFTLDDIAVTSNGFDVVSIDAEVNNTADTYIYVAIRRGPMRVPTDPATVFGLSADSAVINGATPIVLVPPAIDLWMYSARAGTPAKYFFSRPTRWAYLFSNGTGGANTSITWDQRTLDRLWPSSALNNGTSKINYFWRRAPGFFDISVWLGSGADRDVPHNLMAVPELIIHKALTGNANWPVYSLPTGPSAFLSFNLSTESQAANATYWRNMNPSASTFPIGTNVFAAGTRYQSLLFASLPGISKVGSYTGNGSSQTINCGFAAGARFVLIKRTDATGDWYVWDSARGIVEGNDPRLSLNNTTAEVTTDDSIDPDGSGFIVNQVAATNINVTGATYLYLAIA